MPDNYQLSMLIRSTIIALNQANVTGNYTVFRDLGSPGFQSANDAAKLAQIFASLRSRSLDLSPVFFINPTLRQPPTIDGRGLLRLQGVFPSRPQQIVFDMIFQYVRGKWQLFGMAIDVAPPVLEVSTTVPQPGAQNAQEPSKPADSVPKPSQASKTGMPKPSEPPKQDSAKTADIPKIATTQKEASQENAKSSQDWMPKAEQPETSIAAEPGPSANSIMLDLSH